MKRIAPIVVAAVLSVTACASAQERQYIDMNSAENADGLPFSGAVVVGNTMYLAGSIGLQNGQVPDTPREEARLVMTQIQDRLERGGMTMDDLVFVQVFCSDVSHYSAFNEVYRTFFTREFPPRAFIGSGTLLFDARFEVQAIAVRR